MHPRFVAGMAVAVLVAATPMWAQRGGRVGIGGGVVIRGGGVHHGGGVRVAPRISIGVGVGVYPRRGWGLPVLPVYAPYGYYPGYYSYPSYQQPPTVIVIQQPPAPVYAPPVYVAAPSSSYLQPPPPPPAETTASFGPPPLMLIFKNRSVYSATDCWVEDGRLHYTTYRGAKEIVDLDLLDLELTRKVNEGRELPFK